MGTSSLEGLKGLNERPHNTPCSVLQQTCPDIFNNTWVQAATSTRRHTRRRRQSHLCCSGFLDGFVCFQDTAQTSDCTVVLDMSPGSSVSLYAPLLSTASLHTPQGFTCATMGGEAPGSPVPHFSASMFQAFPPRDADPGHCSHHPSGLCCSDGRVGKKLHQWQDKHLLRCRKQSSQSPGSEHTQQLWIAPGHFPGWAEVQL